MSGAEERRFRVSAETTLMPTVYGPHDALWLELDRLHLRHQTLPPGHPERAALDARMDAIEQRISVFERAERQLTLDSAFLQDAAYRAA
jgi:hypothetical protein